MQIRLIKRHKGVGDTIESVLKTTGVHYIANAIKNGSPAEPCVPCQKRKENLNNPDLLINKVFYGTGENS
jgi:hypothetical protein